MIHAGLAAQPGPGVRGHAQLPAVLLQPPAGAAPRRRLGPRVVHAVQVPPPPRALPGLRARSCSWPSCSSRSSSSSSSTPARFVTAHVYHTAGRAPRGMSDAGGTYQVELDVFEGPLDLLLHLVKKHELDILDIPIGFVTDRYIEYLDRMQGLDLDIAGEYLVMAATLCHLKSRELLPPSADDEAGRRRRQRRGRRGDRRPRRPDPAAARVPEVQGGGGPPGRPAGGRPQRLGPRHAGRGRASPRTSTPTRSRRWPRSRSTS